MSKDLKCGVVFDIARGTTLFTEEESDEYPLSSQAPLARLLEPLDPKALRRFAIRCANRTFARTEAKETWRACLRFAESMIDGAASEEARRELESSMRGAAIAAASIGLRHGCSNAATFLSIYATIRESALDGAVEASRMAQLFEYLHNRDLGEAGALDAARKEFRRHVAYLTESQSIH